MGHDLTRRVERLENESGKGQRKFVWLERGETPKVEHDREHVVYVSWDWSEDNAT